MAEQHSSVSAVLRPCVFFDRDGIVNISPGAGWVERWADFAWMPGFFALFRLVRARGLDGVLITNQSGISRGIMTEDSVRDIHWNMRRELREGTGEDFLDILYCPHQDFHGCDCRKPKPGMLLEAARRHGLDLAASWMVGDHVRDAEAGRRAGCRTLLVNPEAKPGQADECVADLAGALDVFSRVLA